MCKIFIIGRSGSGKSTFAKQLAQKLNLKVTHLDQLFWLNEKEWRKKMKKVTLLTMLAGFLFGMSTIYADQIDNIHKSRISWIKYKVILNGQETVIDIGTSNPVRIYRTTLTGTNTLERANIIAKDAMNAVEITFVSSQPPNGYYITVDNFWVRLK